jgi:hypothetical protein
LDPKDPACAGIVDRALRAVDPKQGRDPKDAHQRLMLRKRLANRVRRFRTPPAEGIFPNFGAQGPERDAYYGLPFEADRMRKLIAKIVRGVVYMEHELLIDDGYEFTISFMENEAAAPIVDMAQKGGGVIHREPGISITRAYLPADTRVGVFAIEIWRRCRAYAVVAPKDIYERAKAEFLVDHGADAVTKIKQSRVLPEQANPED